MMVSRFWLVCAFIEMCAWTVLVPYMIWQLWGWIPATVLLVWWLLGYWRLTAKSLYQVWKMRRRFKQMAKAMDQFANADSGQIDPYSQMLHEHLDNYDETDFPPDFSDN